MLASLLVVDLHILCDKTQKNVYTCRMQSGKRRQRNRELVVKQRRSPGALNTDINLKEII